MHKYRDGSRDWDKVECISVLTNITSMKRLPDKSSIYSTEVLDIDWALEIMSMNQLNKSVILSVS